MKPSETTRGQAWLGNFQVVDQEAAQKLLDAVRVAPISIIRTELIRRLQELVNSGEIPLPSLLVPVLSMEDIKISVGGDGAIPIAYENFSLDDRISSTPGSEGFIGNLVRQLTAPKLLNSDQLLPPSLTLDQLRKARVRSIVIMTDYICTGTQLERFAMSLVRNPTLRSWRSFKNLRIHALTFAGSSETTHVLEERRGPLDYVWQVEVASSIWDHPWSDLDRQAIESLCRRYVIKSHAKHPLGYKQSGGLFATDAGVPNNVPWVLRQVQTGWASFFDRRSVPPELAAELGDYSPSLKSHEIAARAGQLRLAKSIDKTHHRSLGESILLSLAILNRRSASDADLALEMAIPMASVELIVGTLASLELIDSKRQLTKAGTRVLRIGKRAPRRVSADVQGADGLYYPKSMR